MKGFKKVLFFILWVFMSIFMMYIGYCITSGMSETLADVPFTDSFAIAFLNPSMEYFNSYTPVGIIVCFIFTEFVFILILLAKMSSMHGRADENDDEVSMDEYIDDYVPEVEDTPLFAEETEGEAGVYDTTDKKENIEAEEEDKETFLEQEAFLSLFNKGYSMPQIQAMMEVRAYNPNVDASLLVKMFKNTMSPDEMRRQIEVFYG